MPVGCNPSATVERETHSGSLVYRGDKVTETQAQATENGAPQRESKQSENKPHNIASFVLRFTQDLWEDAEHEPHVRWRGHIRHVQGEEESRFTDFAQAVAFIQQNLTQLTVDTLSGERNMSQETVMRETFKLWEQFASSYSDIMASAMEQTLKQSELIGQQIEAARTQTQKLWGYGVPSGQNQEVLDALKALQQQLEILNARVEKIEAEIQAGKGQ
jgi:hypothetical protein